MPRFLKNWGSLPPRASQGLPEASQGLSRPPRGFPKRDSKKSPRDTQRRPRDALRFPKIPHGALRDLPGTPRDPGKLMNFSNCLSIFRLISGTGSLEIGLGVSMASRKRDSNPEKSLCGASVVLLTFGSGKCVK